ncbi:hypothetical protein Misp01_11510 [Microtetraspora sp. NBRC 13810]|uniref:FAD:protein FMN transferase n=1 Tax=Microtetraspora sp. NBRC 13810 TaxID=3030990 RepID=UPI0024A44F00|nr:FAD:protein FMN transferase [Microtetraspora sp. NBRC 13810]GLW06021.1 hypothetical protein Misp01_11510 [Microtetraspora sp. NBRC 13810]
MAFPGAARAEQVSGVPVQVDIRTALPPRELDPVLDDAFTWLRDTGSAFGAKREVREESVERLSRALLAAGAVDHQVRAGNAVRVRGSATPGRRWRVEVRDPGTGRVRTAVYAHDLAIATASAAVNDTRAPGRSVTVVGPDLVMAGAYASAISALGPTMARRFAVRLAEAGPYEVLIAAPERRPVSTPGFAAYGPVGGTLLAG